MNWTDLITTISILVIIQIFFLPYNIWLIFCFFLSNNFSLRVIKNINCCYLGQYFAFDMMIFVSFWLFIKDLIAIGLMVWKHVFKSRIRH